MVEHREQPMSALSHRPQNWHQIDWYRVQRTVRAMQIRIAKACKNSNWRKVKALQRILTRSTSARLTRESGWHDHYLLPRLKGGRNTMGNRVLVNPDCHDQVHNLGMSICKPARAASLVKA